MQPDVQTHAAELRIALNEHNLKAQVSRTERRRIAAWACAQHQQVTFQIGAAAKAGRNRGRYSSRWRYALCSCLRRCSGRRSLF